jgi:hypothetical protein
MRHNLFPLALSNCAFGLLGWYVRVRSLGLRSERGEIAPTSSISVSGHMVGNDDHGAMLCPLSSMVAVLRAKLKMETRT